MQIHHQSYCMRWMLLHSFLSVNNYFKRLRKVFFSDFRVFKAQRRGGLFAASGFSGMTRQRHDPASTGTYWKKVKYLKQFSFYAGHEFMKC